MRRRTIIPAAVGALLAAGLTACGGDDLQDPRPNNPEATVKRAFTTTNPFDCETIATRDYLADAFGSNDFAENVLECKRQVASAIGYAEDVAIEGASGAGDRIRFNITVTGGDVDGQTLEVTVVNRGGWWQVADVDGFEPSPAARRGAREQAERQVRNADYPPAVRECIVDQMSERLPLVSIQGLHGGLPPNAVGPDQLAERCA